MSGYGKIADFMTRHAEVAHFQRFDFLNTLDILLLQAELVNLEQELRRCMKEDLESGNSSVSVSDHEPSLAEVESNSLGSGAGGQMNSIEVKRIKNLDVKAMPNEVTEFNERMESARDWYILANMSENSTWRLMLRVRDKVKEYGPTFLIPSESQ